MQRAPGPEVASRRLRTLALHAKIRLDHDSWPLLHDLLWIRERPLRGYWVPPVFGVLQLRRRTNRADALHSVADRLPDWGGDAGWLVDWMANRYAKKNDGHRKPEVRLDAIWFALLIPIRIVVEGVCLSQFKNTS